MVQILNNEDGTTTRRDDCPLHTPSTITIRARVLRAIENADLGLDTTEDNYEAMGADSLDKVEIAMAIEEEFALDSTDNELEKQLSVEDTVRYLCDRLGVPVKVKSPASPLPNLWEPSIMQAVATLTKVCHHRADKAGWWSDLATGEPLPLTQELVGDKMMLIVTEIAEAKEGYRKNLMDDHLPHRRMVEVELADAIIRIADLAGRLNLDLGGAVVEKLAYNASRADHKVENRRKDGGKKS